MMIRRSLIVFCAISCCGSLALAQTATTYNYNTEANSTAPNYFSATLWAADSTSNMPTVAGAVNPAVTQANIATTICVANWTSTIRPSASYTNRLKAKQMAALHIKGKPSNYEEDHLISLELGGNPTDPNNLWPEPWTGLHNAHDKDRLENALHRAVCSGSITLADAQTAIRTDWIAAYKRFVK